MHLIHMSETVPVLPKWLCTADLPICTALPAPVLQNRVGKGTNTSENKVVCMKCLIFCVWICNLGDFVSKFNNNTLNWINCKEVPGSSVLEGVQVWPEGWSWDMLGTVTGMSCSLRFWVRSSLLLQKGFSLLSSVSDSNLEKKKNLCESKQA